MPLKSISIALNMFNFLFSESLYIILSVILLHNLFFYITVSYNSPILPLEKTKKTLDFWFIVAVYKLFFILKMNEFGENVLTLKLLKFFSKNRTITLYIWKML